MYNLSVYNVFRDKFLCRAGKLEGDPKLVRDRTEQKSIMLLCLTVFWVKLSFKSN